MPGSSPRFQLWNATPGFPFTAESDASAAAAAVTLDDDAAANVVVDANKACSSLIACNSPFADSGREHLPASGAVHATVAADPADSAGSVAGDGAEEPGATPRLKPARSAHVQLRGAGQQNSDRVSLKMGLCAAFLESRTESRNSRPRPSGCTSKKKMFTEMTSEKGMLDALPQSRPKGLRRTQPTGPPAPARKARSETASPPYATGKARVPPAPATARRRARARCRA